jgi:hypothetical protein
MPTLLEIEEAIAAQFPLAHDQSDGEIVIDQTSQTIYFSDGAQRICGYKGADRLFFLELFDDSSSRAISTIQQSDSVLCYRLNSGHPVDVKTSSRKLVKAVVNICPAVIEGQMCLVLFLRVIEPHSPEYTNDSSPALSGVAGQAVSAGMAGANWWIGLSLKNRVVISGGLIWLLVLIAFVKPEPLSKLIQVVIPQGKKEDGRSPAQTYKDGKDRVIHFND